MDCGYEANYTLVGTLQLPVFIDGSPPPYLYLSIWAPVVSGDYG